MLQGDRDKALRNLISKEDETCYTLIKQTNGTCPSTNVEIPVHANEVLALADKEFRPILTIEVGLGRPISNVSNADEGEPYADLVEAAGLEREASLWPCKVTEANPSPRSRQLKGSIVNSDSSQLFGLTDPIIGDGVDSCSFNPCLQFLDRLIGWTLPNEPTSHCKIKHQLS